MPAFFPKTLYKARARIEQAARRRRRITARSSRLLARISGQLRKRSPEVVPAFIVFPFAVFRGPLEHDRA
jgi:hypothetical protein